MSSIGPRTRNASFAVTRIGAWQQVINTLFLGIETIVTVWIAVGFVMNGGFSVGMVFAYLTYKTQFLQKSASLVDQGIAFKMLGLHLERLSDIALAHQDVSFACEGAKSEGGEDAGGSFTGRIALRDVRFRYSATEPLVLCGVDLDAAPGDHIAITGQSGGGKSTLIKILAGLIEPTAGEVMVDGVPLTRFGHKRFHDQISVVMQDDHLFAGSILENIALFDDLPDESLIHEAAGAAAIHEDIIRMPMGYETLVGDMGSTLSGGQKQRVLLARALYRRPRLLLIDEGTSHLDTASERQVNAAIAAMGITRIVVAHRAETIAAARERRVMRGGKLVDDT